MVDADLDMVESQLCLACKTERRTTCLYASGPCCVVWHSSPRMRIHPLRATSETSVRLLGGHDRLGACKLPAPVGLWKVMTQSQRVDSTTEICDARGCGSSVLAPSLWHRVSTSTCLLRDELSSGTHTLRAGPCLQCKHTRRDFDVCVCWSSALAHLSSGLRAEHAGLSQVLWSVGHIVCAFRRECSWRLVEWGDGTNSLGSVWTLESTQREQLGQFLELGIQLDSIHSTPFTIARFQRLRTLSRARTSPRAVSHFSAWLKTELRLKVARLKPCVKSIACAHCQKVICSHSDLYPSLAQTPSTSITRSQSEIAVTRLHTPAGEAFFVFLLEQASPT